MTSEILTSYVDGRWADARSLEQAPESPRSRGTRRRAAHPVHDPGTGAQIALAAWADRELCDQAVTAARRELDRFRAWSPRERADLCSRAAELVENGASALAHDLSEEQGKPLELGGNGPIIVLRDADAERAAPALAQAAFWNGGQVCTAAGRILVSEALGDEVADRVTALAEGLVLGPPRQRSVTMGPVHLEAVATTVDRHVGDAVDRGARLLTGGGRAEGHRSALFYRPTVIDHVSPDSRVFAEETFGPVAPITRFSDDDELRRLVGRHRHGLGAAVFTESLSAALSLAERLEAGLISINGSSNYWEHSLPFGGWGGTVSGRGRLGGAAAIAEFTQTKTICLDISQPASEPAKAKGEA